jgi:glycerophosphoryl diester phosphodiesterase
MMDLKQNDPEFVALVAEFINTNGKGRPIFVASRNPLVLRQLSVQAPEALLLMSVPDRGSLNDLLSNYPLISLVDGVTIRQSLINEETAAQLNRNDLMIFAWVVNDLKRVNELLELGVDGVTSDNLAILELVGGEGVPEAGTNPGGATPAATPGILPDLPSASPSAQQPTT